MVPELQPQPLTSHIMSEQILTPKFLTTQMATVAIDAVLALVEEGQFGLERHGSKQDLFQCHIVLLGPRMVDPRIPSPADWPHYPICPHIIAEISRGEEAEWPYPFADIARGKALQLLTDRNDGGTDIQPHLLFAGDTPYWGGAKHAGLVAACSGFSCHHDRMVSGMVLDLVIGMAAEAWMRSDDCNKHRDILT